VFFLAVESEDALDAGRVVVLLDQVDQHLRFVAQGSRQVIREVECRGLALHLESLNTNTALCLALDAEVGILLA
jgi:hypothetical protein